MRFLAVDFGRRRIGLAISDASGTLARPWRTLAAGSSPRESAERVAALVTAGHEDELADLGGLIVGWPRRLNGEPTGETAAAAEFAGILGERAGLPVHLQDERLSSYEAEARLAELEPDWRRRKGRLDAAAAAVILQDYLDGRVRAEPAGPAADFPE